MSDALDTRETLFVNHYICPRCEAEWYDEWSCMADDDCPECGMRHITPTDSEEVEQ